MSLPAALVLALAAPAPVSAEQAVTAYRQAFKPVAEIDCPKSGGEEIVVCARRQRSQRLEESERAQLAGRLKGEAPSGRDALAAGACIQRCPQPLTVNILAIPGFIGKVIEQLRDD